jgi:hypothetical protein
VDDQVVLAIEVAIPACPFCGVGKLLQIGDALPRVVEIGELGVRSPFGRRGGDLAFEPAEEVEEIPDLLRGVGGDPAAALRDDLDEPGDLEPAHGLHDRLLAHPELRLHLLDRNPGSDRVAAVEEPLLELVEDHLAQPVTREGGRKRVRHRSAPSCYPSGNPLI